MKMFRAQKVFPILYMVGFLIGILYVNLVADQYVNQSSIFSEYYLKQYASMGLAAGGYLVQLIGIRFSPFFVILMLGYTRYRKGIVILFLLWTGFSFGLLISIEIMSMGSRGVLFFLAGLFPQYLFYIAAYIILLWNVYVNQEIRWTISKMTVTVGLILIGLFMEGWVNPLIIRGFIKTLI